MGDSKIWVKSGLNRGALTDNDKSKGKKAEVTVSYQISLSRISYKYT
jgi:hypothetical protein